MADFRTRRSAKIADESAQNHPATGLADVASLQRRITATVDAADEAAFYYDTLAEYGWARDVAGLAPSSVLTILKPVLELCEYFDCVPWRLTPRQFDMYFAGPGRRRPSTIRKKTTQVDRYFAFLEHRYDGEIARRFGGFRRITSRRFQPTSPSRRFRPPYSADSTRYDRVLRGMA